MPIYAFLHIWWTKKQTGTMPAFLQPRNWLFRKGNYAVQHVANANPDNHWDKRFYCWTSDPTCGVDVGPKRPLEDLVDPTILEKHNRDVYYNPRSDRTGYYGY